MSSESEDRSIEVQRGSAETNSNKALADLEIGKDTSLGKNFNNMDLLMESLAP